MMMKIIFLSVLTMLIVFLRFFYVIYIKIHLHVTVPLTLVLNTYVSMCVFKHTTSALNIPPTIWLTSMCEYYLTTTQ